ncbi:MAG: UDP-N-acetylmuramate dehydrogenase [bacterium]|nr:UDP-N-acetylmuramate dehydrogenase [bacterium]
MTVREDVILAPYTSLSVGGPARFFIEAACERDVREAALFAVSKHLPLVSLGGGTNILVPDEGVDAVVLALRAEDFVFEPPDDRTVLLIASAGASWDTLVRAAGERELWGIENLAGIPGRAAGALVQNIGAYGAELSSAFVYADVFDVTTGIVHRIEHKDAHLSYRSSIFRGSRRLVILRIALSLSSSGAPQVAYADLVRAREEGAALSSPGDIAQAVRAIRATKFPIVGEGRTAGSFFKNPTVDGATLARLTARYPDMPVYPPMSALGGPAAGAKLSLAWLLDRALGLKGYTEGNVRLFERQPIVLVASMGASAADIDAFACSIERRVREELGITIEREVEIFGPLRQSKREASARVAQKK